MAIDEKAMNAYISEALEMQAPPNYTFTAEQHGQGRLDNTSPDIVAYMPYGLRTIIETEYGQPAISDAKSRLGYQFNDYNLPMKSVIAIGIPSSWGEMGHVERRRTLRSHEPALLMQVVTGRAQDDPEIQITPEQPIAISVMDLVQYAWLAAIPENYAQHIISEVVAHLQTAKEDLTQRLQNLSLTAQDSLTTAYGRHDSANGLETVAGNVVGTLASMIQLHTNLTKWGKLEQVKPIISPDLWQRIEPYEGIPEQIAREWRKIEAIDYMPLSTIAAEMLEHPQLSSQLGSTLKAVADTISGYIMTGISATTNVAAEIWQALIPDRDERAAYYTKPHVAEFLANMTTPMVDDPANAKYNEICAGTGTIARATEENLRFRHYAKPEDDKPSIHAHRMESCIQLTDVNPQSISVATANMASIEPETPFQNSAIFAISAEGGSLNFLTAEGVANMQDQIVGSYGAAGHMLTLLPQTIDICNNNDPYFRSRGGAKNPIPSKLMKKYNRYGKRQLPKVINGQAGLATYMHTIEHLMLKYASPHGKVLPLTAAHAQTYTGFRANIENEYTEVIAVCTAAGDGVSLSADTGIQEMILTARKQANPLAAKQPQNGARAVTCVNLTKSFATKLEAKMFADTIRREITLDKDSGDIIVGIPVGTYNRMTDLGDGTPWSSLGISGDYTILTEEVTKGQAWDPKTGHTIPFALPMTTLSGVSDKGPTHHLLGSIPTSRDKRGAFIMHPADEAKSKTNPSLWAAQAENQTKITCEPTHYGAPQDNPEEAARMARTAGHYHLSRNLRMSAQKIAVAYTQTECMGGSSWNTINAKGEKGTAEAIALFLNSTYGLLIRIGHGQLTDPGRSRIQVRAIDTHPIPDFTASTPQGKKARAIALANFATLRELNLDRISLSAIDPNRTEIDRVVTLMLGIPWNITTENMLQTWRKIMCLQNGVNAGNEETIKTLKKKGIA